MSKKLRDRNAWHPVVVRIRHESHAETIRLQQVIKKEKGIQLSIPETLSYAIRDCLASFGYPVHAGLPVKRMTKAEIDRFKTRQVSIQLIEQERHNDQPGHMAPAGLYIVLVHPKTQKQTDLVGPYTDAIENFAEAALERILAAEHLDTALVEARHELEQLNQIERDNRERELKRAEG